MAEFDPSLLDPLLATTARVLTARSHVAEAAIVANARSDVTWGKGPFGGLWQINLGLPYEVYVELGFTYEPHPYAGTEPEYPMEGPTPKERAEGMINGALLSVTEQRWGRDFDAKIVIALDDDPEWRTHVNRLLSGEGITNQGRVRSDNIAAFQHEGLRFRSRPEICFFDALKSAGVPFAPLPTVVTGRLHGSPKRIEPDFIVWKEGIVLVVEIDGNIYHRETPVDADDRLQCLQHEGAHVRRIRAESCDTPQKAVEAVQHCLAVLDKIKKARR